MKTVKVKHREIKAIKNIEEILPHYSDKISELDLKIFRGFIRKLD